jgi:hypothetical protein
MIQALMKADGSWVGRERVRLIRSREGLQVVSNGGNARCWGQQRNGCVVHVTRTMSGARS